MVAYFKRQNNLFMLAGACLGAFAAWLAQVNGMMEYAGGIRQFAIAISIVAGIVLGRLLSAFWANRRLKALYALLYEKVQPEEFVRQFSPIVGRVPKTTVEYVDGKNKLSYAYEALGEFENSLKVLEGLEPEQLKLHSLAGTALVANQRARLYLLMEDVENAKTELAKLTELEEEAARRAPSLAANLKECVKLCSTWLSLLTGGELDCDYVKEEISLAKNVIYKNEMRLLLAKAELADQNTDAAKSLFREICDTGTGLYTQKQAETLLRNLP